MARPSYFPLALAIGLLFTPTEGSPASPTGFPICTAPGTQDQFSLTAGRRGEATIVWRDARNDPGDSWDIYGQSFDVFGQFFWALGDTGIAICRASGVQGQPHVSTDASGNSWIVWADERDCPGNEKNIYAQGLGRFLGNPICTLSGFKIHTTSCTNQRRANPYVVALDDGAVGMWWHWGIGPEHLNRVKAQRFDTGCSTLWAAAGETVYQLATTDPDRVAPFSPVFIADDAGGLIVAFQDPLAGTARGLVLASRVDLSGAVLWTGVRVCTTNGTRQGPLTPVLVSDGSGGAIVIWEQGATSSRTLLGQRIDATGARRWGTCGKVIAAGSGDHRNAQIVPSEMGRFFVVWETGPSNNADIYAQRINFLGDTLQVRIPVCTAPSSQVSPQAVAGDAGSCIIAWEDRRHEVDGDDGDIYAQQIEANGTIIGRFNGVPACSLYSSPQYGPRIVTNGWGGAVVAWNDTRNGTVDIYARVLWKKFHIVADSIVVDTSAPRPYSYTLHPVTPNPFNPSTTIAYDLPRPSSILLRVYDISGRLVRVLVDGDQEGLGRHTRQWDGRNDSGAPLASGIYYVRLIAGDYKATRGAVLLK